MAESFNGTVSVARSSGTVATVVIDGNNGNLALGGDGRDGDLAIKDRNGNTRFNFSGDGMEFVVKAADGTTIIKIGPFGNIELGGGGQDGDLLLNRADGTRTIHLDGHQGNAWLGGSGTDGDLLLFPANVAHSNNASDATIHLDGASGDIILRNADCAEDFDVVDDDVEAGTVMIIDDGGRLRPAETAYDRRVAGVISGAGAYQPGIILDRQPGAERRRPLAMVGKVECRADATRTPIRVGDLLTTSSLAGHAMTAVDRDRAFGAVIGKALAPLAAGIGSVPVLVGLQ
jgi:hypothetical protein